MKEEGYQAAKAAAAGDFDDEIPFMRHLDFLGA